MRPYRVWVTAQLTPLSALDVARVRRMIGGSVEVVAVDVLRIEVISGGHNPRCAAHRALDRIDRALAPALHYARPPVWVARRCGLLGRWRTSTGRGSIGDDPDDGLGGVREPRRPSPYAGSAAAAVDPDAA